MDYLVGFVIGYGLKEVVKFLNKLSKWDYDNRTNWDYTPLNEDDLP